MMMMISFAVFSLSHYGRQKKQVDSSEEGADEKRAGGDQEKGRYQMI